MTEIITESRTQTKNVRTQHFPALEAGNISYPHGRYIVNFEPGLDQRSFSMFHSVENAPLIAQLIEDTNVLYICAVSSPISSYRKVHISNECQQTIEWNEDDLGEPPLFTPMIVLNTTFKKSINSELDGLHPLWNGREIEFTTGMRLAVGQVVHLKSSILHLLRFQHNDELGNGEFKVLAEVNEGFRFRVELAPDLHKFLQYYAGNIVRDNIVTHILGACFSLLKTDFAEDDEIDGGWRSYRHLEALADFLESKSLPHWSDGEEFIPELIATKIRPHKLTESYSIEDDD